MQESLKELEEIIKIANVRVGWKFGGGFSLRQGFLQRFRGDYDIVYKNGADKEKVFPVTDNGGKIGGEVFSHEFQYLYTEYLQKTGINYILIIKRIKKTLSLPFQALPSYQYQTIFL